MIISRTFILAVLVLLALVSVLGFWAHRTWVLDAAEPAGTARPIPAMCLCSELVKALTSPTTS